MIRMKKNNTPEHTIRIKIGLIFLIVILYFCGIFIYSYTLKKNIDTQEEEIAQSNQILSYTNQLISSIQQIQNITNILLSSPDPVFEQQYDSLYKDISRQIKEMQRLTPSQSQDTLLRNIHGLLGEKNALVSKLVKQFKSQNPLKELNKKNRAYSRLVRYCHQSKYHSHRQGKKRFLEQAEKRI